MWLFETIAVTFSMYSRIPMPRMDWNAKNMRYVFCFLPLVGVVVGFVLWGWLAVAQWLELSRLLVAVGMVTISLLITGGIHMDGFLDTVDALASNAPRERKLEILKDPHTGAFAVIGGGLYLLGSLGLWGELSLTVGIGPVLPFCFAISRMLGGLSILRFPIAKSSGLAHSFADAAAKTQIRWFLLIALAAVAVALYCLFSVPLATGIVVACLIVYLCYARMSRRQFGGITGDLVGWFIQICELAIPAGILLFTKAGAVLL